MAAGTVPISEASPLYTAALARKFYEPGDIKVNNFFRSFFPSIITKVRFPIIEVMRGSEKIAVDVLRGTQGNRNQVSKFDQKAWDTFYFREWFDATELECYFRAFGSDSFNLTEGAEMVNGIAAQNMLNRQKIERNIEYMCAQIFETGKITSLRDGTVVDFHRQASSMVTLPAGSRWTDAGTDPFIDLFNGGVFLRQKGKASGYVINAIFGTKVWQAWRENAEVKDRLKQFNNKRDMLPPAQLMSTGAVYQGEIDADSYTVRCWTYNEFYDDPAYTGTGQAPMISYKDPNTVVMIPENPMFNTFYGAIPQLANPGAPTMSLVAGEYALSEDLNVYQKYHKFAIESAPLPVPVTPDRMYTLTPIAVS
jgi:hypothetical protein